MDIRYNLDETPFVADCKRAINAQRAVLDSGALIEVHLNAEKPGYAHRIEVETREGDSAMFGTDWTNSDPSRFPARIKAAATALFDCRCFGRYVIEHRDGLLTIRIA